MRFTIILLLITGLLLSGCSLFGIATKGELRDMERTHEAERENLRRVISDIDHQLNEIGEEISGVIATIEADHREQELMRVQLAGFEGNLDEVSGQAAVAHEQSQRALRAHLQRLVDERQRLQRHMDELDRQIQGWRFEADEPYREADPRRQQMLP